MIFYLETEDTFIILTQTTLTDGCSFLLTEDLAGPSYQLRYSPVEPKNYGPYIYIGEL